MMKKVCSALLLFLSVALVGCELQRFDQVGMQGAGSSVTTNATMTNVSPDAYILQPSDPLYIRFSGVPDQQYLEPTIDEGGFLSLLLIDEPIKAAGLTTSELENKIERLYIDGGIYKTVSVNVTMTAKTFYVQGQVHAPGPYPLQSGTTLIQAIASARGFTDFAWKKKVTISRHGKVTTYDMRKWDEDSSKDVKIHAGDVITVPQTRW